MADLKSMRMQLIEKYKHLPPNWGTNGNVEEYPEEFLSDEKRLEYLALGDESVRNFIIEFMNITNDTSNENDPGNVYKSIEWAINKIKNLNNTENNIEVINIGRPGRKKVEMLLNHEKMTALYPYSIARQSETGRKPQRIKEDVHERIHCSLLARQNILRFLQSDEYSQYTVCTSVGNTEVYACISLRYLSQPDCTTKLVAYLYNPTGKKLRALDHFWSKPKHGWIKLRYMPLNYEGDSSAYTWCEIFRIMRFPDRFRSIDEYEPSFRSDLFPYCVGNDDNQYKDARAALIERNPGVEKYLRPWGTVPPENQ